jgi:hypothetical protein
MDAKRSRRGRGRVHKDETSGEESLSSTFEASKVKKYHKAILKKYEQIDEIMEAAKEACAPHREEIAEFKKAAANAGIPKKEFSAAISYDRLEQRKQRIRTKLDDDQKDVFDNIQAALGVLADTPLGRAASRRAGADDGDDEGEGAALN